MLPEDTTLRTRPALYSRTTALWNLAIFATWTAMVMVGELYHEFWRDEVRAFSLALNVPTLVTIPATIHGEGHPALWYLLLRVSYDIFATPTVLPILSILIAAAAVIIFLRNAPFPIWFKPIFVLSAIPAYEYSVIARNYGISMLFMFAYAVAYTSPRRSAVWSGLILFLLSQTNIIANLIIPFYLFIWLADCWTARKRSWAPRDPSRGFIIVALGGLAGMATAFVTVYPTAHDLMLQPLPDATGILRGAGSAILLPGRFYCGFSVLELSGLCSTEGQFAEAVTSGLLYVVVAGLAIRVPLMLSALGSLWATTFFFRFVYPGGYRHQDIWVVFLITLYWFAFASRRDSIERPPASLKARLFSISFYGVIPIALVLHTGLRQIYLEMTGELSKSRAIGNLLQTSPDLQNAIVLAEPEQLAEAIPYYADNDIYLLREGKFGKYATWSSHTSKLDLTLQDLLNTARDLKEKTDRPILLLLEYPIRPINPGYIRREFTAAPLLWRFSYDRGEADAFLATTREIPLGPPARLETFDAYLLK